MVSPAEEKRSCAAVYTRNSRFSARFSVRHDTTGFTTVDSRHAESDSGFRARVCVCAREREARDSIKSTSAVDKIQISFTFFIIILGYLETCRRCTVKCEGARDDSTT